MSATRTLATARRVLLQLRHDPRTIAMMLLVPCVLETLLRLIYAHHRATFDQAGAPLLGFFPLTTVFLVTSIALLRERVTGTLERLLTSPLRRLELLGGYALSFGLLAAAQAIIALTLGPLGLRVQGPVALLVVLAVCVALLGTGLGLLASAFARTEFQVVQFFPLIILPQLLLCGLIVARDRMPSVLHAISDALPLSHAVDGMHHLSRHVGAGGAVPAEMLFLAVFGKNVEDAFGSIRYLAFYFAGGLAATTTQTAMTLLFGTVAEARVPNLGASGAIAAVLGAYFVLYPNSTVRGLVVVFPVQLSAWLFLGAWFLYQLIEANFGLFGAAANGGGVAFFAHVGGFIFGVVVTLLLEQAGRIGSQDRGPPLQASA